MKTILLISAILAGAGSVEWQLNSLNEKLDQAQVKQMASFIDESQLKPKPAKHVKHKPVNPPLFRIAKE